MLKLTKSDIFMMSDKSCGFTDKISKILIGDPSVHILNFRLDEQLARLKRAYKDQRILIQALDEIKNGNIIIFYTNNPNLRLSTCIPFFEYKKDNVKKVAINLSNYANISNLGKDDEIVSIDLKKLYCLIVPSYWLLKIFDEKVILSNKCMSATSYMWASMFNKILIKAIALSSNTDRLEAFRYFAMKFFLIYYIEVSDKIAENIATSFLKSPAKNYVINKVETEVELDGINMYSDFSTFCDVMFNNKYTGIRNLKGAKTLGASNDMNTSLYTKKFTQQYDFSTIMSLAAFPYFMFTMFESYNWAYMANDKALEDIFRLDEKLTLSVFVELNKMV